MKPTSSLSNILKRIGKMTKEYSNLPDSYIKRASEEVAYRAPRMIQYLPHVKKRRAIDYQFGVHRPWTQEFRNENALQNSVKPEVFVEPIKNWPVFRGDHVQILVGRDTGKQGIVTQIIQERNWVIVGGMNWEYKRVGKTESFPGTLVREELPLLVTTEISLIDPSDNKPTKISWRYTENGEKVRVSVRTGRIIPKPNQANETFDYKIKSAYIEGKKDTKSDVAEKITFQPELKTFEMDIMESMGITEHRNPKKSYWY